VNLYQYLIGRPMIGSGGPSDSSHFAWPPKPGDPWPPPTPELATVTVEADTQGSATVPCSYKWRHRFIKWMQNGWIDTEFDTDTVSDCSKTKECPKCVVTLRMKRYCRFVFQTDNNGVRVRSQINRYIYQQDCRCCPSDSEILLVEPWEVMDPLPNEIGWPVPSYGCGLFPDEPQPPAP